MRGGRARRRGGRGRSRPGPSPCDRSRQIAARPRGPASSRAALASGVRGPTPAGRRPARRPLDPLHRQPGHRAWRRESRQKTRVLDRNRAAARGRRAARGRVAADPDRPGRSRQTESRPPESSTRTGSPARSRPGRPHTLLDAHDASADEDRNSWVGSVEALHPAPRRCARTRDGGPRPRPPAASRGPRRRRARADPRGEVDRAPVVVAVAVERAAGVDADPRQRPPPAGEQLEADRPVDERGGVRADHHHLVADRLDDPRVVGQRLLDGLDEALDHVQRLLLPASSVSRV